MSVTYSQAYSEYEMKETAIKVEDSESFEKIGCVGSIDESMETITVTKKCEGIVVKSTTRATGNGEATLSLHMRYDLYTSILGMEDETLKDGVVGYGRSSKHKEFCLVAKVKDEDGVVKYIAYPKCVASSAVPRKIENGAEEVSEVELTIAISPDENGFGKYEALDILLDETIKGKWMTDFEPSLVKRA